MGTQIQLETSNSLPTMPRPVARRELPKRLRLLHVVPYLAMGGTEQGILKVVNGLDGNEFEQRICAVRGVDEGFTTQARVAVETYSVGTPQVGLQFPLFRLTTIMRRYRPHIVHTRNFGAVEAIAAARLAGIPVAVHSEHGYELDIVRGLPFRRRVLYRLMFRLADAVFAVSSDLRNYHADQAWLDANRIAVIRNGVDTHVFAPGIANSRSVRQKLQIPDDRLVIGTVGRLVAIKDHVTLLRSAELLARRGKNIHVILVGSGPEQRRLEDFVDQCCALKGRVTFVGSSLNVPELLAGMDVFVLPSICEGMSNTLMEAMSSGLPCIASEVGGNPELADCGRAALLFKSGSTEALEQSLLTLIEQPTRRIDLGRAARLRMEEHFGLNLMLKCYRDLYMSLAARRSLLAKGR